MQVLVVREDGLCFGVEKIVIPYAKERHDDGNVLLKRCLAEMVVARISPLQQQLEVVVADAEHNGEADGTPQRIATAYPIPEFEHVLRIDTELGHCLGLGEIGRASCRERVCQSV